MNTSLTNNIKTGTTEHAKVQGGFNRDFMVQSERGVYRAKLAFSCFVMPQAGDTVLVNIDEKQSHIIAIIERPGAQHAIMSFPADMTMESKKGNVSITSHNKVNITSAEETSLLSNRLSVTSNDAQIYSDKMQVTGKNLKTHWQSIHTFAELITTATDKLVQTIKNSFSNTSGVEQKASKNYLQNVSSTTSIHSQHAVITAKKDMKIDGERIHMG